MHIHMYENNCNARETRYLDALLQFTVTRADVLHDIANAFSWGMRPCVYTECMKSLCVAIASIRNAYDIIMDGLVKWLPGAMLWSEVSEPQEHFWGGVDQN